MTQAGETVAVSINTSEYAGICSFCVVAMDGKSSVPVGTEYRVSIGNGADDFKDMYVPIVAT